MVSERLDDIDVVAQTVLEKASPCRSSSEKEAKPFSKHATSTNPQTNQNSRLQQDVLSWQLTIKLEIMATANPLAACVASLQSSLTLLNSSIQVLDNGVRDFPRLSRVLNTQRVCTGNPSQGTTNANQVSQHFELVPESTLASAQSALLSSITPELNSLLSRVETYLGRLERQEKSLIAKAEIQEGRLQAVEEAREDREAKSRPQSRKSMYGDGDGDEEEIGEKEIERMKKLKNKKERLIFAIERLNLKAGQTERSLRKSMAAPKD